MSKSTYFINEAAEYEFYLLHMDGEKRSEALGIDPSFYRNKKAAKKWRDDINAKIATTGNLAARDKLESMYSRMIDY